MFISSTAVKFLLRCTSLALLVNFSLCFTSAKRMDPKGDGLSSLPQATSRTISNLQMFTVALGGLSAPPITMSNDSERPYDIDGSTFPDFATAATRSCDVQYNLCQDAANEKAGNFTVGDCGNQRSQCETAQKNAVIQSFGLEDVGPDPNDSDFELFCEPCS